MLLPKPAYVKVFQKSKNELMNSLARQFSLEKIRQYDGNI